MTKPILICVGRVKSSEVVQSRNKPFLAVKIEMQPEEFNGKSYSARVEARVRWKYEELHLKPGDWVSVQGQAKAESFEYNGKQYGSLICDMATVTPMAMAPKKDKDNGEEESLPKPKPREKKPVELVSAPTPGDDEIPF